MASSQHRSRRSQLVLEEDDAEPDQMTSKVCRLCLKKAGKDASDITLELFRIIQGLGSSEVSGEQETPKEGEKICELCRGQLQTAWKIRKQVRLTDIIWKNYQNRLKHGSPETPFVLDDELGLYCHVCSGYFVYDSLLEHIMTVHGSDHLGDCRFCETLLNYQAVSNVDEEPVIFELYTVTDGVIIPEATEEPEPEALPAVPVDIKTEEPVPKRAKEDHAPKKTRETRSQQRLSMADKEDNTEAVHGCPVCDKLFIHRHKLRKHSLAVHNKPIPKNTILSAKKLADIRNREQTKTAAKYKPNLNTMTAFECRMCPESFATAELLDEHLSDAHDVAEIIYELPDVAQHLKSVINTDQKPFQCHVCPAQYSKRCRLVEHLREKHKIVLKRKPDETVCEVCHQSLASRNSLARHKRLKHKINVYEEKKLKNESKPQFICPTCGLRCKALKTFDEHLFEHSDTPFTCSFCDVASFNTRNLRKDHEVLCSIMTYTSTVRFQCVPCGTQLFEDIDQLKEHKTLMHGGDGRGMKVSFTCHICLKILGTMGEMIQHLNGHEQMTCRVCAKTYPDTARLKWHYGKTHCATFSLVCQECGQVMSRADKLMEHMWTHNGFECNVCLEKFGSRKAILKHRREDHGLTKVFRKEQSTLDEVEILPHNEESDDEEEMEYSLKEDDSI